MILINDAPYGSEKAYNAFRLAMNILKESPETKVNVFLMADAVGCAIPGQKTPDGYYTIERMVQYVLKRGGKIKACGTCCEARGFSQEMLVKDVALSNMKELTSWTLEADKTLVF